MRKSDYLEHLCDFEWCHQTYTHTHTQREHIACESQNNTRYSTIAALMYQSTWRNTHFIRIHKIIFSANSRFRMSFRTNPINWSELTGFDLQLKYSIETIFFLSFSALHLVLMNIWLNYMWHDNQCFTRLIHLTSLKRARNHSSFALRSFCMKWYCGFRTFIACGSLSVSLDKMRIQFLAHTTI